MVLEPCEVEARDLLPPWKSCLTGVWTVESGAAGVGAGTTGAGDAEASVTGLLDPEDPEVEARDSLPSWDLWVAAGPEPVDIFTARSLANFGLTSREDCTSSAVCFASWMVFSISLSLGKGLFSVFEAGAAALIVIGEGLGCNALAGRPLCVVIVIPLGRVTVEGAAEACACGWG